MLPNDVTTTTTTTFCNQHEAWIGLQERVLSWLHGVHDPEPQTFIRRSSKNRKRHHYSPYPIRCEPPRAPSPISLHVSTLESDFPASASEIISPGLWHVQEQVDLLTTSLIKFKVADDLPDPECNPLITLFATDIEEEYCRLLFLGTKLEADRINTDVRWKRDLSHAAMRELLDIEISIQRVHQSAQYVINYAHHCNLDVDFRSLFLQHYRHPFQQLSPDETPTVHGTSYFSESTLQNKPLYIQDQEISGFDCQALNSDTNIWVLE